MTEATADAAQSNVTSINHWPRLSDEMVLIILSYFPLKDLVKASLINKKFRDLSRDDSLWTELTLDREDIKQNAESCRKLVERCKKLASLKITKKSANDFPLNIMTVVIRAKDTLKSLGMESSYIQTWTPAAMAKLGQIKNLTSLTMRFSSESLAVNGYAGAKMLEQLAKLDKLEVLNLAITNQASVEPRTDSLPAMKIVFEKLKKLKIVVVSLPDFDMSLVATLGKNNQDLMGLHLLDYPSLTDESVNVLAESCPGLQEFSISYIVDSEINRLSSSFPNLKRLFVGDVGDYFGSSAKQLAECVKKFRSLEELALTGNHRSITNSEIEKMVGAAAAKNLKCLSVFKAPRVTKDQVERLRMEYTDVTLRINNY